MQEPLTSPPRGPRHGVVAVRSDADGPAGVEEPGEGAMGVPQELGRSRRFRRTPPRHGLAGPNKPWPASRAFTTGGSELARTHRRYRQAKETKCGGTDGGKSQRPDSTRGAREPRRTGGPRRGKRGVGSRALRKETRRMHRSPDSVSTKRRRIAELARMGRRVRAVRAGECVIRGTVCSNASTYGSVGAPGGQPPGATRPLATTKGTA
jgi:hypothetical protein